MGDVAGEVKWCASREGGLLIPVIAALSSFLVSFISMKLTQNPAMKNDPTTRSMNSMMYIMPIFSLFICYSMNFGVALYWIASNLLSLAQVFLLKRFVHIDDPNDPKNKPEKEKKLNYTQLEKMKRDGTLLNGETVPDEKKD